MTKQKKEMDKAYNGKWQKQLNKEKCHRVIKCSGYILIVIIIIFLITWALPYFIRRCMKTTSAPGDYWGTYLATTIAGFLTLIGTGITTYFTIYENKKISYTDIDNMISVISNNVHEYYKISTKIIYYINNIINKCTNLEECYSKENDSSIRSKGHIKYQMKSPKLEKEIMGLYKNKFYSLCEIWKEKDLCLLSDFTKLSFLSKSNKEYRKYTKDINEYYFNCKGSVYLIMYYAYAPKSVMMHPLPKDFKNIVYSLKEEKSLYQEIQGYVSYITDICNEILPFKLPVNK